MHSGNSPVYSSPAFLVFLKLCSQCDEDLQIKGLFDTECLAERAKEDHVFVNHSAVGYLCDNYCLESWMLCLGHRSEQFRFDLNGPFLQGSLPTGLGTLPGDNYPCCQTLVWTCLAVDLWLFYTSHVCQSSTMLHLWAGISDLAGSGSRPPLGCCCSLPRAMNPGQRCVSPCLYAKPWGEISDCAVYALPVNL